MITPTTPVEQYMTHPVITVAPDASLQYAQRMMQEFNIRHLPVVQHGRLVGLISSGDIRRARPSDATSLSIWELNYLWDKLNVEGTMTVSLSTVQRDTPLVAAVQIMLDRRFSSLPVVNADGELVGILTEVDVFRALIQMVRADAMSANYYG